MTEGELIFIIIIGLLITLAIMYGIIRFATSMKRQLWNQKQQINILLKIAEKMGVEDEGFEFISRRNNEKTDQFLK